jgi:hypothetical protein
VTAANGGMQELRVSDLQIRKPFTERVAPRPGVADMLVEINDEQRPRWFLSYSVGLWRGRIGTVALPLVDFLQRSSHERCLVVLGQAFGLAERRDALLIGQHADRPRPVGAPHATIQPERTAAERDELARLRRENKQLRLERDILSRAAAWFARETGAIPSGSSSS